MSFQGGFQEKNVVFNEEKLFKKIPFFQETTLRLWSIDHSLWEGWDEPAGPDSAWAGCAEFGKPLRWVSVRKTAQMRCEPLPLCQGCQQPEICGFSSLDGMQEPKAPFGNAKYLFSTARLSGLKLLIC